MKELVVSMKTARQALNEFAEALRLAKHGKPRHPRYEVAFDTQRDFDYFVRHMHVLSAILNSRPPSVYALAKLLKTDVSNLSKLIQFYEQMGVVTIKRRKVNGRMVKTPVVEYDQIRFDLRAA